MKSLIIFIILLIIAGSLAACGTSAPGNTSAFPELPNIQTQSTNLQAGAILTPYPQASLNPQDCINPPCLLDGHFLLQYPIPASANRSVDGSYRFGSTQEGLREVHHGVEFGNPTGTPVVAAADGKVIIAGDDALVILGLNQNFYGKVVVIEHHLIGIEQTVFTLYAHLSEVTVQDGESVTAGQLIGKVGKSGAAMGSHLHFEVRDGENTYTAAVNPELWLALAPDEDHALYGALAGIVTDTDNKPLRVTNIRLEYSHTEGGKAEKVYTLSTYNNSGVTVDPVFNENYAISSLAPGWYRVIMIASNQYYSKWIQIEAGKLTYLTVPL